jgi:hypothetical protein
MVAQKNILMQLLVVAQEETNLTGSGFCSPSGGVSGRNVIEGFFYHEDRSPQQVAQLIINNIILIRVASLL